MSPWPKQPLTYWRGERAGNYVFRFLHHIYVGSISSYTTIHMVLATRLPTTLPCKATNCTAHYQHSVLCTHWGGTYLWFSDQPLVRQVVNMSPQATFLITAHRHWLYSPIAQQCTHTHTQWYWVPQSWSATLGPLLWVLWTIHQLTTTIELKGDPVL